MVARFPRCMFVRGQLVEVRSRAEIASTLDANGALDGMPFMPEMAKHCGRRFRVHRRADKTCVEGHGLRRLHSAVFLEDLRCDGASHDGCQRGCLIFWKEAWLKLVVDKGALSSHEPKGDVQNPDTLQRPRIRVGERYLCQSTQLASATTYLSRWNFNHFLVELRNGELTPGLLARIVMRTLINRVRLLFNLPQLGSLSGQRSKNPRGDLRLERGDWVDIKSPEEIQTTLDPCGRNCGLSFEPDMIEYTRGRYRVSGPIRKIILEQTGKMIELKSTVALDGVTCRGLCAKNCPRNNPIFWRESWLRRVSIGPSPP